MPVKYAEHFSCALLKFEDIYRIPPFAASVKHMEATKIRIGETLKNADMGKPNPEMVRQTLEKFFHWVKEPSKTPSFSWLEVALLCRGLHTEIAGHGSLMQSESAVRFLLTEFAAQYSGRMLSPYPWQGLLSAYLNCPPGNNAAEVRNREALRAFLANSLDAVARSSSFKPRWLEGILKHSRVLEKNATRTLAEDALEGRSEIVERIAREVDIPPTSWFWPELVMAQVDAIVGYPDDRFKRAIDPVLAQLRQRRECIDKGLARILDRYSLCLAAEPHEALLSLAVFRWKSPSLERQTAWLRVTPKAKAMVQRWLVPHDLEAVFRQLVEDSRRYEFWLQFVDRIEFTHIWTGNSVKESPSRLSQDREERRPVFRDPEKPDDNLILMKIGGLFILESAVKTGGKCWAYREEDINPQLLKHGLRYGVFRDTTKNIFTNSYGHSDGLIHSGYAWEKAFLSELAKFGIFPDRMTFEALAARYRLVVESLPDGAERICCKHGSGVLGEWLGKHGFIRRADGFYRQSRKEEAAEF
ncbi:EH signature domain-containing protein [Methylomicrobium album]|uniref:Zorya protein ZorC EH domain-containing protein n=1 Tax=Methylomicrobium album BG8 TaxID=686340 RepID=H8GIP6_METAL|nr:EH signature domain-containing protein [Methylomicrobium album]EIC29073.1 hypothetical protein Metal_1273 [Methylomicrobium album BG8]